ncbi:hypothetical protein CVS37_06450 [Burkholderia lata]|nr:hypothetical protein CVS37_06450 [Burkholderia lata]
MSGTSCQSGTRCPLPRVKQDESRASIRMRVLALRQRFRATPSTAAATPRRGVRPAAGVPCRWSR